MKGCTGTLYVTLNYQVQVTKQSIYVWRCFRSSSISASTERWPSCPQPWAGVLRIWPDLPSCSSSFSSLSLSSATCCLAVRWRSTAASPWQCRLRIDLLQFVFLTLLVHVCSFALVYIAKIVVPHDFMPIYLNSIICSVIYFKNFI